MKTNSTLLLLLILIAGVFTQTPWAAEQPATGAKKIGVLLVCHGSRSPTWRKSLTTLEDRVRDRMLASGKVKEVKTAFMEYTEPSIATRLKEFDADKFTDIIVVPVFLTVSPHTFDDIPTLLGEKQNPESVEHLKMEKIEVYHPTARTQITPPLDFTDILRKNVLRRTQALSKNPKDEGLVLIAYGDDTYEKQWIELLDRIDDHVKQNTGISAYSYGWCGHLVHYDPDKTTEAIQKVLAVKKTAVVIPVLVAYDEMFQIKIIGDGIAKVADNKTRVLYKPDSILPDTNVENWILDISEEYARKL